MNKENLGDTYAKRPINILQSAKRRHAATAITGQQSVRNQRKEEKAVAGVVDEMAELREHAAEQAALFNLRTEDTATAEESTDHLGE